MIPATGLKTMIDWNVVVTGCAFMLAGTLAWVLIALYYHERKIKRLNKRVQALLDGDDQ